MSALRPLHVSVMRQIITRPTGERVLKMGLITGMHEFTSFRMLAEHVLHTLRYPLPHTSKEESFGWTPTWFDLSERVFHSKVTGLETGRRVDRWRRGEGEIDLMSVWVGDVDNASTTAAHMTVDIIEQRLIEIGLSAFLYTSFSHRPERHKYRVVVETDRDMSRAEALHVFLYLDEHVFFGQGDPAIYDPADFLFAPPHDGGQVRIDGSPLPVDLILEEPVDEKRKATLLQARERTSRPPVAATPAQQALMADTSTRDEVSIYNSRVCRPEWVMEYAASGSGQGHWQTMRSIMGKVWLKSGGSLTRAEMDHLLHELDGHCNGYFREHHGNGKAHEIISFVMRQYAEPLALPTHPFDKS